MKIKNTLQQKRGNKNKKPHPYTYKPDGEQGNHDRMVHTRITVQSPQITKFRGPDQAFPKRNNNLTPDSCQTTSLIRFLMADVQQVCVHRHVFRTVDALWGGRVRQPGRVDSLWFLTQNFNFWNQLSCWFSPPELKVKRKISKIVSSVYCTRY